MRKTLRLSLLMTTICVVAMSVRADPLAGTWLTPRDGKGIEAHIEVKPCGGAAIPTASDFSCTSRFRRPKC